jgi:predicted ATP-grasp superfamily ATP-dependent carboligase
LNRAGFEVASLAFPGALIAHSRHVSVHFKLPELASDEQLLFALAAALEQYDPRFLIPGDDSAVELAHALACNLEQYSSQVGRLRDCLTRSLGDSKGYSSVQSRERLHELAQGIGARVPAQSVVVGIDAALAFAAQHGFPVVLKKENSCAGFGTQICRDAAAISRAFAYFASRMSGGDAENPVITVQRYITGPTAMRALLAYDGHVVAGLTAIKVETHPAPTGPSTVVRFTEHPEMTRTAEMVVEALGIAGFASFDFIIEDATDAAYLIELNPRVTPICHLGGAFGPDLCGALWERLTGQPPRVTIPSSSLRTVALFPQEWIRAIESSYLGTAHHDVPWDDPGLCAMLVSIAREQMGWTQLRREEERRGRVRALRAR